MEIPGTVPVGQLQQVRETPAGLDKFDRTVLCACVILAVGLLFSFGVIREWRFLNGSQKLIHWVWPWRNLGIFKTAGLLFVPFLTISWVLWRAEKGTSSTSPWLSLALLVLSNYLLQMLGMLADPRGLHLVEEIVRSPGATSYFTDALSVHRPLQWLAHFQSAKLSFHSMTHPPGPILFYCVFLKLLGISRGALIGGCVVGLLGSAGAVVTYIFAELWTSDQRTRLTASAFYALLPALTVFFPEFDEIYPLFSMLLVFFWVKALIETPGRTRYASYAGVVLFVATFFAYNVLTVGTFLVYFGLYWLWRENWTRPAWINLLRAASITLGVFAGLDMALWLGRVYHPLATFRHAMSNQALSQSGPYYPFPIFSLYDFFLGAGIIALPIILFHLQRILNHWDAKQIDVALTLIALATILTTDFSGLLRAEAARVWLFLQPLLVVPVALALSRYPWRWKLSIFTLQWWIVVCLKAKMSFVSP